MGIRISYPTISYEAPYWQDAAELGHPEAYTSIGYSYDHGRGVEIDETKARHYYELAAIRGSESARHNLGAYKVDAGNVERAIKHFMIAVRSGQNESLERIKWLYTNGQATKEDYTKALREHIKHIWVRLRVFTGIKLLQQMRNIVTISAIIAY